MSENRTIKVFYAVFTAFTILFSLNCSSTSVDSTKTALTETANCGNGQVDTGEQCDDGNSADADGCSSSCSFESGSCGDGILNSSEACDAAGDSATCDIDCTAAACGDGYINTAAGEQCDDGNSASSDGCSSQCQVESGYYYVGGTITGLTADTTLVLDLNGTETKNFIAAGSFKFNTLAADGSNYTVSISSQPAGQLCSIINAGGSVSSADVTDIGITCTANFYNAGGTASGIPGGESVEVTLNNSEVKTVSANGTYIFSTGLPDLTGYFAEISAQPATAACVISNQLGTVNGTDVNNINISCSSATFTVSGNVTGLGSAETVTLQLNGADDTIVTGGGSMTDAFSFSAGGVLENSAYYVTLASSPANKSCTVSQNGSGVVSADVTTVTVDCAADSTGGIDFIVESADFPAVLSADDSNYTPSTLNVTVRNAGDTAYDCNNDGDIEVSVWFSTDGTTLEREIGRIQKPFCLQGAAVSTGVTVPINNQARNLVEGAQFLIVEANSSGAVNETGTAPRSNTLTSAVTIQKMKADLYANDSALSLPAVAVHESISFSFTVSNNGPFASSAAFEVQGYISSDSNDLQGTVVSNLGVYQFTSLVPAGGSITGTYYGAVSDASTPAGNYTVWLDLDSNSRITETDENNNTVVIGAVNVTAAASTTAYYIYTYSCLSDDLDPDTFLSLRTSDGNAVLFEDDDSGPESATKGLSTFSKLSVNLVSGQSYYIVNEATQHSQDSTCYNLNISTTDPGTPGVLSGGTDKADDTGDILADTAAADAAGSLTVDSNEIHFSDASNGDDWFLFTVP